MRSITPVLIIKKGSELDLLEINQMVDALFREFKLHTDPKTFHDKLFFLYKSGEKILAMGGLWEVNPFIFDGRDYSVHGVVEVIANDKGKGYGKIIMKAIHDYIIYNNLTGFGFCRPNVKEFYQKCGFKLADGITQRFIYRKNGMDITNQDGQIIFYQDGADELMKKVLVDNVKEVLIPTDGLW